ADQPGRARGQPIDLDAATDGAHQSALGAWSLAFERELEVDFAFESPDTGFESREWRDDRGEVGILRGAPAEQLTFDVGPRRAGRRQDVHGFEQVGLALTVAATKKQHAWLWLQPQMREVPEVHQRELAQPHSEGVRLLAVSF